MMHFAALLIVITIAILIGNGSLISIKSIDAAQEPKVETENTNRRRQNNYNLYRPYIQLNPYQLPYYPMRNPSYQQSLTDILESVAANDDFHCISRILCEMTTSATRRNVEQVPSSFPFTFINLDSVLTMLSSVDDSRATPLAKFGKAFIMGYTSKNIASCRYAYPKCPNDPDKLVHYLNNHNGGLFRFFNGIRPGLPYKQQQQIPQRRIQTQTKPNDIDSTFNNIYVYDENRDKRQYAWRFPSYDDGTEIHNYENDDDKGDSYGKRGKSLKFPNEDTRNTRYLLPFYLPDRTGTGDLIFDLEKFQKQRNNDIFVFKNLKSDAIPHFF